MAQLELEPRLVPNPALFALNQLHFIKIKLNSPNVIVFTLTQISKNTFLSK